ncbi:MAG: aspartate aminotransferase family protein [Candidatus Omnitrophica bacterium]|nr:aspartate aminotransferase family protein [Candidatus Omnitrophota bacterium]
MKKQEIFDNYDNYILHTYIKTKVIFVKGKGSYLWDIEGKKYLDFFPGWGVGSLGHCHPKVMSAIKDQVSKLIFIPNSYYHIAQAKLAKEIIYYSFKGKVFFCNSGAEANEAAIKLARKFGEGKRYEIISFENSFHGRTLGALALTGQERYQRGFEPLPEGFRIVKFNDIEAVSRLINEKTVAVILELVQGEGGVNLAKKEFVLELRKLCDKNNLLLIVDEVQTGVGRTAKMFCYQHYDIIPDVMTLAKALAGGLPIGCMVVRDKFSDLLKEGEHASTFGGGPVVCRGALAVLRTIQKEKLLAHAQKMGEYLLLKLNILKNKYPQIIKEIRGIGLMWGIELYREGIQIVERCFKEGLLINCTHQKVLRIMPALNVTYKEIDKAINILERVIKDLR